MRPKERLAGKSIELVTSAMASGGDAVARDSEGKAVFVRGGLPGERVRVRLVADYARYAIGSIDELVEPSPTGWHHRALKSSGDAEHAHGSTYPSRASNT